MREEGFVSQPALFLPCHANVLTHLRNAITYYLFRQTG